MACSAFYLRERVSVSFACLLICWLLSHFQYIHFVLTLLVFFAMTSAVNQYFCRGVGFPPTSDCK